MRVLIVDDDRALGKELKIILHRLGHEAKHIDNAMDAIEPAEKGDYDIVLIDYRMPEHNGTWFMRNVNMPRKTKALLVTSYVEKQLINHMFKMGASGYMIKPFDEEDLIWHLDYHSKAEIRKHDKEKEAGLSSVENEV